MFWFLFLEGTLVAKVTFGAENIGDSSTRYYGRAHINNDKIQNYGFDHRPRKEEASKEIVLNPSRVSWLRYDFVPLGLILMPDFCHHLLTLNNIKIGLFSKFIFNWCPLITTNYCLCDFFHSSWRHPWLPLCLTSPTQEGPLNMKEWMMVNFKLGETNVKMN